MIFDVTPRLLMPYLFHHQGHAFFGLLQLKMQFGFIFLMVGVLILGELFALVFGIYLVGYFTRSLDVFASGHDLVAQGNLDFRLPDLGQDQLGSMSRGFNAMVDHVQELLEKSAEREKMAEELRIARQIQQTLLPDMSHFSHRIDVAAVCVPARDVGGDYYELLPLSEHKLGIFIADVSGKGTSAAFYMAELKGVLLALRPYWNDPLDLMIRLNAVLIQALERKIFISALYLTLDLAEMQGQLIRAGHSPLLHLSQKERRVEVHQPKGVALGLLTEDHFARATELKSFPLGANDVLMGYTDGLDEIRRGEELFGQDRIEQLLLKHAADAPAGVLQMLLEEARRYMGQEEPGDDLTVVIGKIPPEVS
jgi:serine phosphatase RsbU (regulator of sigma subunit)